MTPEKPRTFAKVTKILGRTGTTGELTQVLVTFKNEDGLKKAIRRNIMGAVREGDLIELMETEREAKADRRFDK